LIFMDSRDWKGDYRIWLPLALLAWALALVVRSVHRGLGRVRLRGRGRAGPAFGAGPGPGALSGLQPRPLAARASLVRAAAGAGLSGDQIRRDRAERPGNRRFVCAVQGIDG